MSWLRMISGGRAAAPAPDPGDGLLAPSGSWSGTADSVSAPTDPTRVDGKPTVNELFPAWLPITEDTVIGVFAEADDGIEKVTFHLEGTTLDVTARTTHTYTDVNGNTKTQYGYHATLDYSAFAAVTLTGVAHLYVTATANDAALEAKVIGPFKILAVASLYDRTSTVGSGGTYSTIKAAIDAGHALGFRRQQINIVSSGEYEIGQMSSNYTTSTAWTTITAADGVTAKIVGATVAETIQHTHDGLCFRGSGIQICPDRFAQLYADTGGGALGKIWFDGCTWENDSGDGTTTQNNGAPFTYPVTANLPYIYFTDVVCNETWNGLSYARLVRGCTITNIVGVALQNNAHVHRTTVDGLDCTSLVAGVDALTITRAAGPTTATYEVSGSPGETRTLTLKENGSTISGGTLSITSNSPGTSFVSVQDIVDFINTKSGWTATFVNGSRRGIYLSKAGLAPSAAIPATNCLSTVATVQTVIDVHSDGVHHFGAGIKNRSHFDVRILNASNAQIFFLDQSSTDIEDAQFDALVGHKVGSETIHSRVGSVCRNVGIKGLTLANQALILDTSGGFTADARCRFTNIAVEAASWSAAADTDLQLNNIHVRTSTAPSGATNSSTGGTNATLYNLATATDFSPILDGTLKRTDLTYAGALDPAGAVQVLEDA